MALADRQKTVTGRDVHAAASRHTTPVEPLPVIVDRGGHLAHAPELHEAGYGHGV